MALTVNNIPGLDRRTLKHFGLERTGVFASPKTHQILTDLEWAVEDNKLVFLNGSYGTGKTTIMRQLKNRLFEKAHFVHVKALDDRKITMGMILTAIIKDTSTAKPRHDAESRARQVIRLLGQKVSNEKKPVCLIIDNTPDRLHLNTLNALKLLREEDFAGLSPLLSIIILSWPEFMSRIDRRKDITQRGMEIRLDADSGWFTFPDRVKYLEDVFAHAITEEARKRIANLRFTPEDLNFLVTELMIKGMQAGYHVIDDKVIQPSMKETYEKLKQQYHDEVSYKKIGDISGHGASTVKLAIDEEPDRKSTLEIKEALLHLAEELNGFNDQRKTA
ncbi:MAG: AAA family ATPase [Balneola sp.]